MVYVIVIQVFVYLIKTAVIFLSIDMVLDNMIASGQLDESIRENVREALLKRHHHQNEKRFTSRIPLVRSFADIGKKHSDPHLLERNGEISFTNTSTLTAFQCTISIWGQKDIFSR